ncbi:MAG: cytochrome c biogenesis protein CcsA [Bacteroidia bacterium]|nr:cytochrome c biogenesis protein CcsA [Bacteroidia bacterium]
MNWISPAGEHLWAGQWGHILVLFSFVMSAASALLFFSGHTRDYVLGKKTFFLHFLSTWGIALLLIFMLFNRYFEYQYVWQHSNREMDMKYVLSCLWEGQEGSFLLWICWNSLLGLIYARFSREHENLKSYSMGLISLIQLFLTSMIMGVYVGDYKLGSSPFLLLREHPDFMNLPFLMNEKYLEKIDGRGLNPLLMNYWMVIHPPVLFLGFSLSMFPFVQIVSRLLQNFEQGWHRHVLSPLWLAVAVLGTGILMGGAWAYESLSFGGFWAWDPVENSSLVPWMMLVAGGHMLVIDHRRKKGFVAGIFISSLAFVFVLYSTFLTRSGILGNASVHSFTDLGMQGQLLAYLFFFLGLLAFAGIPREKMMYRVLYAVVSIMAFYFSFLYEVPSVGLYVFLCLTIAAFVLSGYEHARKTASHEIHSVSREFHMYLGAMIFFVLSLLIIFLTSLPVINTLSGSSFAMPKPIDYSMLAIPFVFPVLFMMGYTQWMKYKNDATERVFKDLRWIAIASILVTVSSGIPLFFSGNAHRFSIQQNIFFLVLYLSAVFVVFSNYLAWQRAGILKWRTAGTYLSHLGFGILVLGALISVTKKSVLSKNTTPTDLKQLGKDYNNETAALLKQNDTVPLGPYMAVYRKKERKGMNVFFYVDFFENKENQWNHAFTLTPKVQDNPKMGKASDPDTKHYIHKDIYTYVSYADLSENNHVKGGSFGESKNYVAHLKDTIVLNNAILLPDSIYYEKILSGKDTTIRVFIAIKAKTEYGKTKIISPYLDIKNQSIFSDFHADSMTGIMVNFWKINPQDASFEFLIREDESRKKDFIVLEALLFPGINILWLGCILLILGLILTFVSRWKSVKE